MTNELRYFYNERTLKNFEKIIMLVVQLFQWVVDGLIREGKIRLEEDQGSAEPTVPVIEIKPIELGTAALEMLEDEGFCEKMVQDGPNNLEIMRKFQVIDISDEEEEPTFYNQ